MINFSLPIWSPKRNKNWSIIFRSNSITWIVLEVSEESGTGGSIWGYEVHGTYDSDAVEDYSNGSKCNGSSWDLGDSEP